MPNKRKNRGTQKFFCPYCEKRLWRLGSTKHYLYFEGVAEVKQHFKLSRKNASMLVSQAGVQVDTNTWLEEFYCEVHDRMWLIITRGTDGPLTIARVANDDDWKRTTKTTDPELPNASVGEHTYRMSRGRELHRYLSRANPT